MQGDALTEEVKEMDSIEIQQFFQRLEEHKDSEARLNYALKSLDEALSQPKGPDFKAFWEIRKKCIELFKDHLPAGTRSEMWNRFSELSKEARRIKEFLDTQSDYAAEQIEIAIVAIETEIERFHEGDVGQEVVDLSGLPRSLEPHAALYQEQQGKLHYLNMFASRITALRKELIKTDMRIRKKNQFFDRLSKAGDAVFPLRKELILSISQTFQDDVDYFVQRNFTQEEFKLPLYILREEIKCLQNAAKVLSLNTQVFSTTRLKLSSCWDEVKERDKERKNELEKKKDIFKQNATELKELIDESEKKFDSAEIDDEEALKSIDHLVSEMRNRELGRDEVRDMRTFIGNYRDKVKAQQQAAFLEKQKIEEARHKEKVAVKQAFEDKLTEFLKQALELSIDEIQVQKQQLLDDIQASGFNKSQKLEFEKKLKPLIDIVREKKQIALRTLPSDQRQAIEQLKELYSQKIEEKDEIKAKLEGIRKMLGSSGLDIKKAMEVNMQNLELKEKFKMLEIEIQELEEKIESFES